jgi:hypothetical protein
MGNEAVASGANSVAIGNGATATNDGQVVIASLDTSTTSQMGPIAFVTADANGTLGVSSTAGMSNLASFSDVQANSAAIMTNSMLIADNSMAIMDLQNRQTMLFDLANENSVQARRANEGVALALAMESPVIMPDKNVGVAGGFGYYNEKVAGSASFGFRVSDSTVVNGGVGVAFDSGEVGARAGFQSSW